MQITIDTRDLTETDRAVLAVLAGEITYPEPKKAPAKKAAAPKAAKAPEPEVDDEEDPEVGEDTSPTMADAVARATELVSGQQANKVKAALADIGVKRVSELKGSQIAEFLAALDD